MNKLMIGILPLLSGALWYQAFVFDAHHSGWQQAEFYSFSALLALLLLVLNIWLIRKNGVFKQVCQAVFAALFGGLLWFVVRHPSGSDVPLTAVVTIYLIFGAVPAGLCCWAVQKYGRLKRHSTHHSE